MEHKSKSYEEKMAEWRRIMAEANKELDKLEALKQKYLEEQGYAAAERSKFYTRLLERIEEARAKLHIPQPTVDEEFKRRW